MKRVDGGCVAQSWSRKGGPLVGQMDAKGLMDELFEHGQDWMVDKYGGWMEADFKKGRTVLRMKSGVMRDHFREMVRPISPSLNSLPRSFNN